MKGIKLLLSCFVVILAMICPIYATTKEEYKDKVEAINQEMKGINSDVQKIRENIAVGRNLWKDIVVKKNEDKTSVNIEKYKKAKEVQKQLNEYKKSLKKDENAKSNKDLRKEAIEKKKEGNFDGALVLLNQVLDNKKEQLEKLKKQETYWKQIEDILK